MAYTPPDHDSIEAISVPGYTPPDHDSINVVMGKLTGWENSKYFDLTISASDIDSTLTNFPVLLNLGTSSGKGDVDSYTKLLIHSDTTDGSTTFDDNSAGSHTITTHGNTHHEVDRKKFGDTSIFFDGTDDYLSIPDHDDFELGNNNFTMDCWVNFNDYPSSNLGVYRSGLITKHCTSGNNFQFIVTGTATSFTNIRFVANGLVFEESYSFSLDTWYHVAVVRSGNSLYFFR